MSVPSHKRSQSRTEYIKLLFELNVRMGEIVMNKPKKYRENYGDELIKSCMQALRYAQIANGIFVAGKSKREDYLLRRRYLQQAKGTVESIATLAEVFLERAKRADREESKKIIKQEMYIGEICAEIQKKISGVMKSDTERYA